MLCTSKLKRYLSACTLQLCFWSIAIVGCHSDPRPSFYSNEIDADPWLVTIPEGQWVKYPGNPLLPLGPVASWDHWALMSMTVLKAGDTYHMYYEAGETGLRDLRIGHAASADGIHWEKNPKNPVLTAGKKGEWDEGGVWDPFVLYEDGLFKMWYGGERIGHKDFHCGYATSTDGTNFVKHGKVSTFSEGDIGDMHVIHDAQTGLYYMYYWDRRFKTEERLKVATSPNETDFDFANAKTIRILGERPGHRYTHVFKYEDKWLMVYSFENKPPTGLAWSDDGIKWAVLDNTIFNTEDPEILPVSQHTLFMYYCPAGLQDEPGCDIRLCAYKGNLKFPR